MDIDKKTQKHIISALRLGTITWVGRTECLNRDRKRIVLGKFKNGNVKKKWVYKCQMCKDYFNLDQMEVDHIVEIGPFAGDWNDYISRMYCGQENLQALCTNCHSRKTSKFNASLLFIRKNL